MVHVYERTGENSSALSDTHKDTNTLEHYRT